MKVSTLLEYCGFAVIVALIITSTLLIISNGKIDPKLEVKVEQGYFIGTTMEDLPELIFTSEKGGTLTYDTNQIVEKGYKEYKWTFIPKDKDVKTIYGSIILYNADIVEKNKTYTTSIEDTWLENKYYIYDTCTFEYAKIEKDNVEYINCTFKEEVK